MKVRLKKRFPILAAVGAFALTQIPMPGRTQSQVAPVGGIGPRIEFAQKEHDFGKVGPGASLKCEFVFTNTGDSLLVISNVSTSCGCTTAGEWARQVEPGQTGKIPIQFNVGTFSGVTAKSITVTCNDRERPTIGLQVKATVWKPVDTIPQFAVLNANAETLGNASATVRVVNNEDAPLAVFSPESSNPLFVVELKTNQPGKEFELRIKMAPNARPENTQGQITVKTSSTNSPNVSFVAMVVMQPLLSVSPPQINLPAGPLQEKLTYGLLIRYNGTNVMTLSDPAVNVKDVKTGLKELEPGRAFNVEVSFPPGFEIAPGQNVEFSVKSSHPEFPVIKVPISQLPRPVTTAALQAN